VPGRAIFRTVIITIFVRQTVFENNGNSNLFEKYWTTSKEQQSGSDKLESGKLSRGICQNHVF
ncbi:hypothetical protein, partial [Alistipes putredinis]|uniref:hypothetical protein n=1 Tax=Alistipes putredinis TaxID=28117 RepID=UPI003AB66C7B